MKQAARRRRGGRDAFHTVRKPRDLLRQSFSDLLRPLEPFLALLYFINDALPVRQFFVARPEDRVVAPDLRGK